MIGFVVWTIVVAGNRDVPDPVQILAVLAVIFAARLAVSEHHDGAAFTASAVAIAAAIGSIFINLYPNVMVSSTNSAYNLTVNNSASGSYALKVMTVVAILFVPLVLAIPGLVVPRLPRPRQGTGDARSGQPGPTGGRRSDRQRP